MDKPNNISTYNTQSSPPLKLRSIAIDYLYDGMVFTDDIYNHTGKILLMAKGTIVTDARINQLKNFNEGNRNISVYEATYNQLMEAGIDASDEAAQTRLENKIGYTTVKDDTANLLDDIASSESISKKSTDIISSDISQKLNSLDPALIFQCLNAQNKIDEYLRRHCINVAMLNGFLGKWLDLSDENIDLLILSGLVHDIGKTKIPTEILDAPRRLTISEFEIMKMHPLYSYVLLSTDPQFVEPVKTAALQHHEKMNGSGYPKAVQADKISLFARITAVSDIYDAMVSKRAYKEAHSPFTTIADLAALQYSDLDPNLVAIFKECMPKELLNKSVLLSDGSIGTVNFIVPDDLEHPLIMVNGVVKKTDDKLFCIRMVADK